MSLNAKEYQAIEPLRHGGEIAFRALKPEDRTELLAAVEELSPQSLRRRFFAPRRAFSEEEISYFVEVDFLRHVALVAELREVDETPIIGGARYIVVEPGKAEIAFAVIDEYQGRGVGAALMRHLVRLARDAGLRELIAEVLPENSGMMNVFKRSGLSLTTRHVDQVVHVSLRLA